MAPPPAAGGGAKPAMQEAKVNVKLPADAKLFVDDQLTTSNNKDVRSFKTPALAVGQDYYYTMRAEYVRDGKTVSTSKRVIVRAGTTVETSFEQAVGQPVAAK